MNNSGDAAEQVVRLSLEGFEVVAKVSGEAAKNIAVLLLAALKQEQKAKGKARLSNLIKSGKELKVFSIPQKDLKKFTEQAKRYGVLYSVLKDRNAKGKNVTVDIIARAEDASKIDRIIEKLNSVRLTKAQSPMNLKSPSAKRQTKATKKKQTATLSLSILRQRVRRKRIKTPRYLGRKKTVCPRVHRKLSMIMTLKTKNSLLKNCLTVIKMRLKLTEQKILQINQKRLQIP
mgnify:CR=1 FL=1